MINEIQVSRFFLLLFFTLSIANSNAQKIDTLSFHVDKGLLVIKGYINNKEVDLIMDTGSPVTATTDVYNSNNALKPLRKKIMVRDANNQFKYITKVKLENLTVGNFSKKNIEAISFDMPFMVCQKLILLGQDFMKPLNWKFDFETNLVYCSYDPFSTESGMDVWNIQYKNNKPYINLQLENKTVDCLIDLGFTGYLDVNKQEDGMKNMLNEKSKTGATINYLARIMGFVSTQTSSPIEYILADSIQLSKTLIRNLPVSISDFRGAKIGLHFFTSYCSTLIINNTESNYYLTLKEEPKYAIPKLDAEFVYEDNRLKVIEKNTSQYSSSGSLAIGEDVLSIDGKTAGYFGSDCNLIEWRFKNTQPTLIVEKMDGSKVVIKRSFVTNLITNTF